MAQVSQPDLTISRFLHNLHILFLTRMKPVMKQVNTLQFLSMHIWLLPSSIWWCNSGWVVA